MLQALQQGQFYLEMKQMGLTASQVRTLLKGMAAKINETKAAFAYRYVNTFAVYVRVVGPTAYEESFKTKARRLLVAADLPVPVEFEGPQISLSSGHSQNFQSPSGAPGPGTPPRRREHFIGTPLEPSPPFPAFNGFSSPKEERWENESLNGSQGSEVAAMLNEIREARRQDAEIRKKELEVIWEDTKKKEIPKVSSIFKVNPNAEFPKMGDKDHDVEAHMEEFEDLCTLANPNDGAAPAEKLRLLGKTLEGAKLEL